jgi:hypothetical protein
MAGGVAGRLWIAWLAGTLTAACQSPLLAASRLLAPAGTCAWPLLMHLTWLRHLPLVHPTRCLRCRRRAPGPGQHAAPAACLCV